jgi:hypothetical protein
MTMQRDTSSSWIYFLAIGLFYFVFLYLNANAISKETFIVDDDFYQHKYATAKELDEEKQITEILSNVLDSENTVLKNKNEASKREKIEPRNGIQQDTEAQITTKNAKIEEIFFLLLKVRLLFKLNEKLGDRCQETNQDVRYTFLEISFPNQN